MEKFAQPGEGGGGARPLPFTISTNTYQVVVYAQAERADALSLFLLYPCMYSVAKPSKQKHLRAKKIFCNPLCVRMVWVINTTSEIYLCCSIFSFVWTELKAKSVWCVCVFWPNKKAKHKEVETIMLLSTIQILYIKEEKYYWLEVILQ
jgi:hypothetical protein